MYLKTRKTVQMIHINLPANYYLILLIHLILTIFGEPNTQKSLNLLGTQIINHLLFRRLDYFLISDNLQNSVIKTDIKSSYKSDHSLISINLNLNEIPKGPGVFKLNNSLLLDTAYQTSIRNAINNITDFNKDCDPNVLWELIKGSIRNESIKYSTLKKKQQTERENEINKKIERLENDILNSSDISVKQKITEELLEANKI